jgi:hypothetical protein
MLHAEGVALMRRLTEVLSSCALCLSVCAAAAHAQPAPERRTQLGVAFEILPLGKLTLEAADVISASADTAVAFGVAPAVDFALAPVFSIGLAPRFLFRVRGEGGDESATQLDLRARALLHPRLSPAVRLQAYVAPGYSILYIPDWPDELDRPAGLVLAFGGGLTYDVSQEAFLSFDVGYQLGFQKVSEMGESVDVKTRFLHLGLGAGARF